MNAYQIQKLLQKKHEKDVYVPECKNGSTWFQNHLRLDGLSIARSWANPVVTGYEIKVSRSDFLRDEKYHMYLKYCNRLYFVCPSGLIDPTELSDEIGLLWTSTTGSRLYTKKKAPHRNIEIPAELYKYILISRAYISDADVFNVGKTQREYWESWLEDRKLDHEFGRRVSSAIREEIDSRIAAVERENKKLNDRIKSYDDIIQFLESIGVEPTSRWIMESKVNQKIEEIRTGLPDGFLRDVNYCIEGLQKIGSILEDGE